MSDIANRKSEGVLRPSPNHVVMDEEWLKLQGEQEPAFVSVVQQVQIRPTVVTTRIVAPKPVEVIPDSSLIIAARNYAQAAAFLDRAQESLTNSQRVYETAVDAKQKAFEELKRVVAVETQEKNDGA